MMTGSLGMVMGVPTHGRFVGQPAEELGDLVLGCRPDNEVPMIGHQAVGKDRQPLSDAGLGHHPLKRLVVPRFLEQRESGHRSVEDVEADSRRTDTGSTRHRSKAPTLAIR